MGRGGSLAPLWPRAAAAHGEQNAFVPVSHLGAAQTRRWAVGTGPRSCCCFQRADAVHT